MGLPHQHFAESRVMVMAAPNGARRSRQDHPALPLATGEIVDCAVRLAEAGVSVLHLHVRDDDEQHTLDTDRYRETIAALHKALADRLVIQVTTEAVGRYAATEQMAMVRELRPEAVSLALSELCPDEASVPAATRFFAWLNREQVWPQYILYSAEELRRFDTLRHRGVFAEERPNCLLVLGRYSDGLQGDPGELETLLASTDCSMFPWSLCCFGGQEQAAALAALERGGHVRLGFENNLLLADGKAAGDNAALIDQFVTAAQTSKRVPASADEVRAALFSYRA